MKDRKSIYPYLICIPLLIVLSSLFLSCKSPAVINYFSASPTVITSGQAATLQWDVRGTTRVNINNGIGDVASAGKAVVTPKSTTTYLLTVPDDSQRVAVTVEVKSPSDIGKSGEAPATEPDSASKQADNDPQKTSILRYDNLDSSTDDYLSNQIAVWHTYAKLPGSNIVAPAGYAADVRKSFTSSSATGIPVKSPLIILPSREGMFCIVKNYAKISYLYFKIGTTWYGDDVDELDRLNQPGWGLMTTFSLEKVPFKIQRIDIAAAANLTGSTEDYDKYHFIVRILDENGRQIWNKLLPWSLFRGDTSAEIPKALWKSVEVDNVSVNGDFSVEVLTESNEYLAGKSRSHHYFALAYEKINNKDVTTRSIISEGGYKSDNWIRLYDPYGQPLAFNLCIRAEGIYLNK